MDELTEQYANTVELLQERMAALELALEDASWQRLIGETEQEFSRDGLRQICAMSRVMYLKNPLIQRGVNVQRDYVFGQGISVRGKTAAVDEVVQGFWNDGRNQAELTSHQALMEKEVDLAIGGNLFFVLFTNLSTGRVRVRSIPVDEVVEIVCNPEDGREPWLYRRRWGQQGMNLTTGVMEVESREVYYPDWRWNPGKGGARSRPYEIGGIAVMWDQPVYHVRVGGLPNMRFGAPEVYAAIDWARAYKSFLEDWATIVRAYSRFAFQLTVRGGKAGIAAAKVKLASTLSSDSSETNPAPAAASTFIGSENATLQPVRTSGATTSAEDARRLLLMVAATMGLPETFFGDASVGSLATAQSLDRPTELKFLNRQTLWADVLTAVCDFVVAAAVKAGKLAGVVEDEEDGTPRVTLAEVDPETGDVASAAVYVSFPPILEHDVAAMTTAITQASALGVLDDRTLAKLMLQALGENNVDEVLEQLFPDGGLVSQARVERKELEPAALPPDALSVNGEGEGDEVEEAAGSLRSAMSEFIEAVKRA
jgi:hypothetical protein